MRAATLSAGLLVLVAAAPCPAQAPAKDAKAVTVPFKLLPSRHMMIEAKVNGKGPYNLIFDTGAPLCLLDTRLAKDAGLLKRRGGGLGLGFGLFGGMNQVEVDKLQVGGVVAEKLPAVVMDHPTVRAISDAFEDDYGKIDGIVGFPFFGRYATTVDYQKKELTLKPTNYVPGDYLQDISKVLMGAAQEKVGPKVVGAAGLWGFTVGATDDGGSGVVVGKVYPGGAAEKAGLKADDRVLTIDGRWTDSVADAYLAASLVKPGRAVAVVVKRGGKEETLTVTPAKGY